MISVKDQHSTINQSQFDLLSLSTLAKNTSITSRTSNGNHLTSFFKHFHSYVRIEQTYKQEIQKPVKRKLEVQLLRQEQKISYKTKQNRAINQICEKQNVYYGISRSKKGKKRHLTEVIPFSDYQAQTQVNTTERAIVKVKYNHIPKYQQQTRIASCLSQTQFKNVCEEIKTNNNNNKITPISENQTLNFRRLKVKNRSLIQFRKPLKLQSHPVAQKNTMIQQFNRIREELNHIYKISKQETSPSQNMALKKGNACPKGEIFDSYGIQYDQGNIPKGTNGRQRSRLII